MPKQDGTGPEGKGPKTGRQVGNCEGAKKEDCPKKTQRCPRRKRRNE